MTEMEIILLIAGIILGGLYGFLFGIKYINKKEKENAKKTKDNIQSKFLEAYVEISKNKAMFKSRIMNTCYIKTKIPSEGDIELLYLIDKKDLAIVKNNEVVYTSHVVDKALIKETIDLLEKKYHKEINDTISIFGLLFSKKTFEEAYGEKLDSFEDLIAKMYERTTMEKLFGVKEKKVVKKEQTFDIDDIFDKISETGINSLTTAERKYLEYYSNNI